MSRSLKRSHVDGSILECIWHNMRFNIETGAIVYKSGFIGMPDLKVYGITVKKGAVYIRDEGDLGLIRRADELTLLQLQGLKCPFLGQRYKPLLLH